MNPLKCNEMKQLKYIGVFVFSIVLVVSCNPNAKKQTSEDQVKSEVIPEVTPPASTTIATHLKTYVNSVYRYHIDYPDDLLIPQGESDSGDGQVFTSKDKLCELRVYRDTRDILYEGAVLRKSYREDLNSFDKDSLSNSELSDNYYIIEGKNSNEYFYQKTVLRKDNLLITAILTYKPEVNEKYKPIVSPIFNSIH